MSFKYLLNNHLSVGPVQSAEKGIECMPQVADKYKQIQQLIQISSWKMKM